MPNLHEEVREELGPEGDTVLVLVKRGDEIFLRREEDVLEELDRRTCLG